MYTYSGCSKKTTIGIVCIFTLKYMKYTNVIISEFYTRYISHYIRFIIYYTLYKLHIIYLYFILSFTYYYCILYNPQDITDKT